MKEKWRTQENSQDWNQSVSLSQRVGWDGLDMLNVTGSNIVWRGFTVHSRFTISGDPCPFMHQCWGLPRRLAQCMSLQGWDKLVKAPLLSLMRRVWVYAVLPSSCVNSSAPLVCRHDLVTREAGRVGLMGRDQGRRGYWVTLYLFILPSF